MRSESIFHIFRNTPYGRDAFSQCAEFAGKAGVKITIYIPKHRQFLMYFDRRAVTVDLDHRFVHDPKTAREHAEALVQEHGVDADFFVPKDFTAADLPDVPVDFQYMCCPRSIGQLSSKIGMGFIGTKVRQIIQYSSFPVLIPTWVHKEWRRIVVFFGGSSNAVNAVKVALDLQEKCGLPITLFTRASANKSQSFYEDLLGQSRLLDPLKAAKMNWMFFSKGNFSELLYEVPSDALAVVGAYTHGVIKEFLFGSKMEEIQTRLPNNMLIVGPNI